MKQSSIFGFLTVLLVFALGTTTVAQTPRIVPRSILDQITNDEEAPLPRYMTPHEALVGPPAPVVGVAGTVPSGTITCPPEYSQSDGIFLRWGYFNDLITQMAVAISTGDPDGIVYIAVAPGLLASCSATLTGAGADMSQIELLSYTADSVWMRDYGPRGIFEDSSRGLIDTLYYPARPLDDAFPGWIGPQWSVPVYDLNVYHSGGNFHTFANGDAFMTDIVYDDNPGVTEPTVISDFGTYYGVDLTIFPAFPYAFDGTGHIDMWMLPTSDTDVIIGLYSPSDGAPYTITENATTELESRGYTVRRVQNWNFAGTHYTYTNAVIFNNIVFMPTYAGYTAENAAALDVFEEAFPGRTIVPVDCTEIIQYAGAIHCIVMHVPEAPAGMSVSPSGTLVSTGPQSGPFSPSARVFTITNNSDSTIDYLVESEATWLTISGATGALAAGDSTSVTVAIDGDASTLPGGVYDEPVTFTNLTTHDGDTTRTIELRVGDPELIYEFTLDSSPGWSIQGQWAFGSPSGAGGGTYGYPDPSSGATGSNVYGVNLSGDYSLSVVPNRYLTTTAIDCSDLALVTLKFQRWLNSDFQPYAGASVEVSNNGSSWTTIWQNAGVELVASSWSEQEFDISAYADGQSTLYVRWGYYVASQAYPYSGWNVDDIEIWGVASTPACTGFQRADVNIDGMFDLSDPISLLNWLFAVTTDPLSCDDAADANDDGMLNLADAVSCLDTLFGGAGPLPAPFGSCGDDPTSDTLDCASYPSCCP